MQPTILYLIRHGEVEYKYNDGGNKLIYGPNTPLSTEGKMQIQILSQNQTIDVDVIYTSPFRRAWESAYSK